MYQTFTLSEGVAQMKVKISYPSPVKGDHYYEGRRVSVLFSCRQVLIDDQRIDLPAEGPVLVSMEEDRKVTR